MPRTRTELQRDAKVEEIVAAAVHRLGAGGYDGLSVAGLARDLGLAQNAVYWYFPTKDHLFVAALERMVRDMFARKPPASRPLEQKILWFVEQLDAMAGVRASMYDRARSSEVVAAFADGLFQTWRKVLTNVLRDRVPDGELEPAAATLLATIQGALLPEHSPAERRRLIEFAVRKLVG